MSLKNGRLPEPILTIKNEREEIKKLRNKKIKLRNKKINRIIN